MGKIHVLPEQVISHIAAGEVIERPAYAVKELIENALDAGSTSIEVQLEDGGMNTIVVTDTGEGMNQEDAVLCSTLHSTSKISTQEDLHKIQTMGFRGEALASIAAVSRLHIRTRARDASAGTYVLWEQGKVESVFPYGMPIGTQVTVEGIFNKVPARKKFLKSVRTELRHTIDVVVRFALANPQVRFVLAHNGKAIYQLQETSDIGKRIQDIFGKEFFENLMPFDYSDSYIHLSGFIASPHYTSHTQQKQFLFVNTRWVHDTAIASVIKAAYGTLIERSAYPIFFVYLSLPVERVDVNVHPRKEQVNFVDNQSIYDALLQAMTQALSPYATPHQHTRRSTDTFTGMLLKDSVAPWQVQDISADMDVHALVQVHDLYLVIPTKKGMILVDQHAAHERILYEQFREAFVTHRSLAEQTQLHQSVLVQCSAADAEIMREYITLFTQSGFDIEEFQDTTFIIRAVPQLFVDRDISTLIREFIEDLTHTHKTKLIDTLSDKILKYLACRAAIKAGDHLTQEEGIKLVKKLYETPNHSSCPHGRPTMIQVPLQYFHKLFKRE